MEQSTANESNSGNTTMYYKVIPGAVASLDNGAWHLYMSDTEDGFSFLQWLTTTISGHTNCIDLISAPFSYKII